MKKQNKFSIKICPKCRSSDITLYMGGKFGKYICKKCGYIGPIIIEKTITKKSLSDTLIV